MDEQQQLPQLLEETTLDDDSLPPLLLLAARQEPVISNITEFPLELQVNILTYLRAYDLTTVHQTCHFYHNPALVHAIVVHAAEGGVYPVDLTQGFEKQPVMAPVAEEGSKPAAVNKAGKKKGSTSVTKPAPAMPLVYTFEHLRNMELLVVARVLSRPEPTGENGLGGGYYVSKSWCKTALKWLECQQERQQQYAAQQQQAGNSSNKKKNKKLSKKQQRLRQRKYSDASPPWPNVNSDIVCCHQQLQRCSNRKSARARRKILDKQAWKCLKKLYPESISLEAQEGECLQCILEAETVKKTQQQREEQLKEERKAPLSQPELRRFYTRSRGVPVHCLTEKTDGLEQALLEDCKPRASSSTSTSTKEVKGGCPLIPGTYYALPRAWCHAWRKYMKTGEGGTLLPPDGSALLCDAHRLSLLPPHLESYLYGESTQLWGSKKLQLLEEELLLDESQQSSSSMFPSPVARRSVVGLSPQAGELPLPADLGLSPAEVAQQHRAMMTLERQRDSQREREAAMVQQDESGRRSSIGEQLDRENYCCVEILAHDELEALEKLWPRGSMFRLSFEVLAGGDVAFTTPPCRECDASGMANFCKIPKNKAHLRAAHQARVRIYKEQKSASSSGGSKPEVQLEY